MSFATRSAASSMKQQATYTLHQNFMRHSSVEITAKVYVHETMDTKRNALIKVSELTTNNLRQKVAKSALK